MITEIHGWGTAYYSDDGARCATVEKARAFDPDSAHVAILFNVLDPANRKLFNVVRKCPDVEIAAHAVAVSWVSAP